MANDMLALAGILNETRTYNSLFQLTRITVPGALDLQYAYSATQNNGKLTSQTDVISGEQVLYTYDVPNRLATAQAAPNPRVTKCNLGPNCVLRHCKQAAAVVPLTLI